ncbi:hypothetical protein SAMN04489841_3332 [Natrinema salaciae]|uniref:Uncharacterized protein n=1 Tax=Natrinema salaciae TaxID=1186196 RepID=A0A1H9MF97_9EURY|nr:hypothetical protein SAMN04489841_3332 [Natrinema salaciae]
MNTTYPPSLSPNKDSRVKELGSSVKSTHYQAENTLEGAPEPTVLLEAAAVADQYDVEKEAMSSVRLLRITDSVSLPSSPFGLLLGTIKQYVTG